ncbi:MAG: hypothetical protein Q9209_004891 [Squamulea sp. 1 TL-2023]
MDQVPRVPLLKQDGAHTRYVKGGLRPGRSSDDLRPQSLNTGQTSILDILKEGPPQIVDSESPAISVPTAKFATPKKEGGANKISFGSIRKIFSPKQKFTDAKSDALDLQQAFKVPAHRNTENQEAAHTTSGSDGSLSPSTADNWEREWAVQTGFPGFVKAHGVAPHQRFGGRGASDCSQQERDTSGQITVLNGKKLFTTIPKKSKSAIDLKITSPSAFPCGYSLPETPGSHAAPGKIYGQPPLEMVSPVVPHRVTKEHLNLSSYPSLSREALAQLPKDLEPTLPILSNHDSPKYPSQPSSPQLSPCHRSSLQHQGNTTDVRTVGRSASNASRSQSPRLSQLHHKQSMTSVADETKTPEDYLGHTLPDLEYKKNGEIKKYKDNDTMMTTLGFQAIKEIYGRQAAVARFAPPVVLKAATWEASRAVAKEEERPIGLGISNRTSTESRDGGDIRCDRGYSNGSRDSLVQTPVTPRSGYTTPRTPKEVQEFYENLYKPIPEDTLSPKKIHGDFGLSSPLPRIHEGDLSATHSPFDDPYTSVLSTSTPYTLEAPGRLSCGQTRKSGRPDIDKLTSNANTTSSMAKLRKYFHGCTPDSIRNTRLSISDDGSLSISRKNMRLQILSRLREITGTETRLRSSEPGQAKHPSHGRQFYARNLQCTEHMGHCGVCGTACCVYYEAIEAARDAATIYDKDFAHEIGRAIMEACRYAHDLSTFLRCAECSRKICPKCIGICPVELCQLIACKKSIATQTGSASHIAVMRTFDDTFSGEKIYPGKGKLYVRGDSKIFRFQNGKTESLFLQRKNPRRIAWTTLYRRQHKKGISEEVAKKRTRRTVKQQRGIVGASLDVIKERRSQRPEARVAARQEAIKAGKEKKASAESKKKQEKAKSAAGAARGQGGKMVSKQGAKGAPSKATGKVR